LFGSLALVADGWRMSTHAAALTISAAAYHYARRHATNPRFAFGTGKLGDLADYTSAVVLGMIALLIAYQSIERLLHPVAIAYGEAIAVASLGLTVSLIYHPSRTRARDVALVRKTKSLRTGASAEHGAVAATSAERVLLVAGSDLVTSCW
jgi:cation diffusion facilitator family transporter